ncbi:DUF397 domain-containing protein [Actinomadura sp. 9N407]|uniref:DUF397 domain-containing protein n=1 Tax=Actinomadura sp. 9N407 TaxID=3375154 RepID=UPI0037926200
MKVLVWRKSSRSNTQGNECVEVADLGGNVGLRDSKAPEVGHLTIEAAAFAGLVRQVKAGWPNV